MQRIRLLLAAMLLSIVTATAQDLIVCTDGTSIAAKVEKITSADIEYKKSSNLNGPTYTIPVSSVKFINYENGTRETFQSTTTKPAQSPSSSYTTRAQSGYNDSYSTQQYSSSNTSDADLLRYYRQKTNQEGSLTKYRNYKRTAWIGGSIILVASIATFLAINDNEAYEGADTQIYIGVCGSVAAVGWTTGWLIAANRQKRMYYETYSSAPIFEHPVFIGKSTNLMAGVDVFNNTITRQPGIGLGLRLNF